MGFDKELIGEMPAQGKILFLDYEINYRRSGSIMIGVILSGPFKLRVEGRFDDMNSLEKLLIEKKFLGNLQ